MGLIPDGSDNILSSGFPWSGKKSGKGNFFQVSEKSGKFGLSQGN